MLSEFLVFLLQSRIGCETPADRAMFSVLELVSGSKWHVHLNTLNTLG